MESSVLSSPRAQHTQLLDARRLSIAQHDRVHTRLGYLRLAIFLIAAAIAYASYNSQLSPWWLLLPAAAFLFLGARIDRLLDERARLTRAAAFHERAIARLDGNWAGTGETGARFLDEHHLYADDLDLFGNASLFQLLSNARTAIGEQTLASWLLEPAAPEIVRSRQQAVGELAPRLDLREDLAVLAETARTGVHAELLATWGEQPPLLKSGAVRSVAWILSAVGLAATAALIAYFLSEIGVFALEPRTSAQLRGFFLTVILIYTAVLWHFKARTARIIHDVEAAAHDLGLLAGVLRRIESERFSTPLLGELRASLDTGGRPPSRRIARLDRLVELLDSRDHLAMRVIGPLLLWDIHLSYAVEDWRRASGPAVRRWLHAVGSFEALSSLSGYRFEHPADVFPEIVDPAPHFTAESLRHPLLDERTAVPNDVSIEGEPQVLIVSGSNMSGKSTLLRAIGVNAVLAQAGAPVRATRLTMSPLAVAASIRVQDSLQTGTSRFYAEITRLRHIMEQAGGPMPVLFLIDEFLHGTNSHDRRIGAAAVVRGLVERHAIGLITTHDLALAHIAGELGARGANVHFEDHLENGRMRFDYRMRPGIVRKSNALELMRSIGLEV